MLSFEPFHNKFLFCFSPVNGFRANEQTLTEAYQLFKTHVYGKSRFRRRSFWTGSRCILTKNVNNHCFPCMIRETTTAVIHLSTEAPLWDSNFLLLGRNCFALHSCPCIIIFPVLSPPWLIQLHFIQQYLAGRRDRLAGVRYYHPSDHSSSASLQQVVQYRCQFIPEKLSATAQTNHGNTCGYTVTGITYVQYTQQETEARRQRVYVTLGLFYISPFLEMNRAKNFFYFPPDEPWICTARVIIALFFSSNFTSTSSTFQFHGY